MPIAPSGLSPGLEIASEDMILNGPASATVTLGGIYAIDTTIVSSGRFTTVRAIAAGDTVATNTAVYGVLVVALETTTVNGAKAKFRLRGYVDALIETTTNDVAVGDPLIPVTGQAYLIKAVDPTGATVVWHGICAIACEARTTNAAGLQRVLFDGSPGARGVSYSLA
jgi:hypothetical protein